MLDHARALLARHKGQRDLVSAFTLVNIDKVHTRSCDLHHGFVRLGLRDRQIRQLQNFRSTGLLYLDGFHVWVRWRSIGGRFRTARHPVITRNRRGI
jgi:hypothetical protein